MVGPFFSCFMSIRTSKSKSFEKFRKLHWLSSLLQKCHVSRVVFSGFDSLTIKSVNILRIFSECQRIEECSSLILYKNVKYTLNTKNACYAKSISCVCYIYVIYVGRSQ